MGSAAPVAVGLCRNEKHEYWWNGAGPLTSITTAMKAVDKSDPLMGWAHRETAKAALRHLVPISAHVYNHGMPDVTCPICMSAGPRWDGPVAAAENYLKRMPGYQRDKAADMGTRVHRLAEAIAYGQDPEIAEDEAPRVTAYLQWKLDYKPVIHAVEYMVCHLGHGYAGTGDLNATLGNERWCIDIKTGSGAYQETALQLAAAVYAEFSGRPGDPQRYRVPPADRFGVLHLRADGTYGLIPYAVTDATFVAFLEALDLWRWLQGEAKTVMSMPLTGGQLPEFPKEEAA